MFKILLTAFASLAFVASAAFAADDVMASRYGNTTVSTDAKGVQTKVYYKDDHTFTAKQGTQETKGTWKVDNGTICLTYATPLPGMPNPLCVPVVTHKVGDTWTTGEGDTKRTVTLVKGIQ